MELLKTRKREWGKTLRARLAPAIIAAIIAGCVAISVCAAGIIADKYPSLSVETNKTMTVSFSPSTLNYSTGSFKPGKGTLYVGYEQTKGNSNCKYKISYKTASASKFTTWKSGLTCQKNNKAYGGSKLVKADGRTTYHVKVTKTEGTSTASTLKVYLMLG